MKFHLNALAAVLRDIVPEGTEGEHSHGSGGANAASRIVKVFIINH
jgi:hypothetical protein